MTGVETHPDSRLVFDAVDDPTQMDERTTDRVRLAACVLDHCNWKHARSWESSKGQKSEK